MSKKKALLKPLIKASDKLLGYPKVRRASTRVAASFINRYTNNGTQVEVAGRRHFSGPWEFMLDTPKLEKTSDKKVYVSGWFVPHKDVKYKIRLAMPSGKTVAIKSDVKRFDVAETLSGRLGRSVQNTCGFGKTITIEEDGEYRIELMTTKTWKPLCSFQLRYDPDFTVGDIYNGNMATNYAAHVNLISNKKQYFFEPECPETYEAHPDDAKLITFYLPQFHPFKENNEWWGKGFTEWTNVSAAVPRYVGHEQPKLPADLGFYDLRLVENVKNQIDLAKKYGIHAFCFYYYWFSGKRLMEQPLDTVLKHKEWDFNFMICWANENWTRRWDGRNQDILIAQEHRQDDPLKFIKDVEPIITDPRYVKVNGRPVLAVYRADELDNTENYAKVWREYIKEKHGLDLQLVAVQSFSSENPKNFGFDKAIEFAPLSISARLKKNIPRYDIVDKILDVEFTGAMYDYRPIALNYYKKENKFSTYRSVMPRWDNDARRKGSGGVFANANPDLYGHWLSNIVEQANNNPDSPKENLVFINAWNEWAEGAYLEPDTMYGHSYLRRTAEVLAKHSKNATNKQKFPMYNIHRRKDVTTAVIVHLFYPDLWEDFKKHLSNLDEKTYDLFVTVPKKAEYIKDEILKFSPRANVIVVPNRGRDVLPFLHLARHLYDAGYEKFLKVHSKKSTHRKDGNLWINDMLKRLIPSSPEKALELMEALDRSDTGIVGPYGHYISLDAYFGSNEEKTYKILEDSLGSKQAKKILKDVSSNGFFAGTMFWGRFDAILPILDQYYQADDFEYEAGQVDATFAHAGERTLTLVPRAMGRKIYTTDGGTIATITAAGVVSTGYQYANNKTEEATRLKG
ncbi:glycoside hydrolase family 99-like domain-containing protein [Patescibacteria group bacterium]|nr:glycoside hydrolase family 99-like domain-containing protein [Patescibacteria group bacterium]